MSELWAEVVGSERVAVLSGPNISREIAAGLPAATVVASVSAETAKHFQALVGTPMFRAYTDTDVVGVELSGALKNIVALGAGAVDGMGYGDNAKAGFITRGLAEIARFSFAKGANPLTVAGLAGVGDLVVTCMSKHSPIGRWGAARERACARGDSTASGRAGSRKASPPAEATLPRRTRGRRDDADHRADTSGLVGGQADPRGDARPDAARAWRRGRGAARGGIASHREHRRRAARRQLGTFPFIALSVRHA